MRRSYVHASSIYEHLFEVLGERIQKDMDEHKTKMCWRYTTAELAEPIQGRLRRYIVRGRDTYEHESCIENAIIECFHRHLLMTPAFKNEETTIWVALWNDWRIVTDGIRVWVGNDEGVLSSFYRELIRNGAMERSTELTTAQTQRTLLRALHLDEELLFC